MALKKVKMKTSMAGTESSYAFGEVVDVEVEVADAWVEAGIAEPMEDGEEDDPKKGKGSGKTNKRATDSGGSKKSSKG